MKPTGQRRPTRNRTRTQNWWAERNHSLTVACVGPPAGCDVGPGEVCRDRTGTELVNWPSHQARLASARATNPQHLPLLDPEETP